MADMVLSLASSDSSVSSFICRSDPIRPRPPPRPPRDDSRVRRFRRLAAGLLLPASAVVDFRFRPEDIFDLASPEEDPSMSRLSALRLSMSTSEESPSGDLHRGSSGGIWGRVAGGVEREGVEEAVSGVSEEVGGSVAGMFGAPPAGVIPPVGAFLTSRGPCTDSGTLAKGISSLFCTFDGPEAVD